MWVERGRKTDETGGRKKGRKEAGREGRKKGEKEGKLLNPRLCSECLCERHLVWYVKSVKTVLLPQSYR